MPLRMWMLDVAREQSPTLDHLYQFASTSLDAGYDSLGLYLEHRFAYPSAPWATGKGCITPDMVRSLRMEFPSLQVVPFINLLGHMEGFLNCEQGSGFRETPFRGMQGCPSNPDFTKFCRELLSDTLEAFDSETVHIGGDETWELAMCPRCAPSDDDRKSQLYGDHFGPLAAAVVASGRRPAVWGDMFLEHPDALKSLPKETLLFDWQYFGGVRESAPRLGALGHSVVGCPSIQTYSAAWMHLELSEANVRQVSQDVQDLGLHGVCLTTWECGLFGAYDTVLPCVTASKGIMEDPHGAPGFLDAFGPESRWASLMGVELNALGGVFGPDGHRHRLKSRLLLYSNPFLAWKHHAEELSSEIGLRALEICERAIQATNDEAQKGVAMVVRGAVEFVRIAEAAHRHYMRDEPEMAVKTLAPARHLFDTLETLARRTQVRIGGSLADVERCKAARKHVETVMSRIQKYGRKELGYLPSFDTISHPRFIPHDQACWWGVNKWGDA